MFEPTSIAVTAASQESVAKARGLARQLGIPHANQNDADVFTWLLVVRQERLELKRTARNQQLPIFVDFSAGHYDFRRRRGGGRKQLLARAAGLKKFTPRILDATAGLGRDAFVFAGLGCEVLMLERSPLFAALLADGLHRAAADPELAPWLVERLKLESADARIWQPSASSGLFDVVYLDPMYPANPSAALAKKESIALRELVGADCDADQLLSAAFSIALKRVVVKRPKSAQRLAGPTPDLTLSSEATRFDIYFNG